MHAKGFTANAPALPVELPGAGARRRIRHQGLPTDSRGGCRQPLWNRRWVAGRLSFAMSAEAGREFDKLATALTTPRHSLTREVNLVVSLSRTPSLITSPFRSHLLPSYDRFALFVFSVRQRGAEAFNQLLFTHRRATSFPVAPALSDNRVPASVQNPSSQNPLPCSELGACVR